MFQHHQFFLSEPVRRLPWLLLALLESGPADGEVLLSQVSQQTGTFYEPGTLYRWVALVERRGWVERVVGEGTPTLYRLTTAGVVALGRQRAQPPRTFGVKENLMRFVSFLVRLYPPAWRERYEEEMLALLELHTITPWTIIDLLFNSFRTWLDPSYRRTNLRLLRRRISAAGALLGLSVGLFLFAAMGWIQASDFNVLAHLDPLATVVSRLAAVVLTPIGMVGEMIAFFSLLLVPFIVLVQRMGRRAQKTAPGMWLLRLLPGALALFFFFLPLPAFLGVTDWGFNGFLFLTLMGVTGEMTVLLLSQGKAWLERNGSRLIMAVSGFIMAICICNAIWTWTAWHMIPGMDALHPGWIIQLAVMVLATMMAGLSLVLSLGVSRRLRERRAQPF